MKRNRRSFLHLMSSGAIVGLSAIFFNRGQAIRTILGKAILVRTVYYNHNWSYEEAADLSAQWLNRDKIRSIDEQFKSVGSLIFQFDQKLPGRYSVVRIFRSRKDAQLWEREISKSRAVNRSKYLTSGMKHRTSINS